MKRILRFTLSSLVLALAVLAPASARAEWPDTGLPVGTGPGVQSLVDLVADGEGGAFVIWRDEAALEKRVVRITRMGVVATGWPAAGVALPDHTWLGACGDGAGGLVLFMLGPIVTDPPNGIATRHVLAWRLDGSGAIASGWPAIGRIVRTEVRAIADDLGFEGLTPMGVAPDGSGGAYLALQYARGWGLYFGYHMTHVTGDATAANNWDPANGSENQSDLRVEADGSGGVIVAMAWTSDILVRRYGPTGAVLASWGPTNGGVANALWLTRLLPGADLVVSWRRFDPQLFALVDHSVRLTPELALAPGWTSPLVVPFAAAWPDGQGGAFGERDSLGTRQLQRLSFFSAPPVAVWPQTRRLSPYDVLEWDGEAGLFQLWADLNEATVNLWAVHILASGADAPGWGPIGRRLTWLMTMATARKLARVAPGVAFAAWTDSRGGRDVYAQRLIDDPVAGVDPPAMIVEFALHGFVRNPIDANATVEFALPDAAAASLELYDVSGRRLARRDVGGLGIGRHRVSLAEGLALPAGVYCARLTRGGRALVARGALLR